MWRERGLRDISHFTLVSRKRREISLTSGHFCIKVKLFSQHQRVYVQPSYVFKTKSSASPACTLCDSDTQSFIFRPNPLAMTCSSPRTLMSSYSTSGDDRHGENDAKITKSRDGTVRIQKRSFICISILAITYHPEIWLRSKCRVLSSARLQ
jgi:hypothetical protein